MSKPAEKYLKWALFAILLTAHIILSWKALQLNWVTVVAVAIWPVLLLEAGGIKLETCQNFICFPDAAGLTVCLLVWAVTHYLLAKFISGWTMRR